MQHPQPSQQHSVNITKSEVIPVKRKLHEYDDNQETIETEEIIYYVKNGYTHRDVIFNIHVVCECGMEIGYFSNNKTAELAKEIHLKEYANT